MHQLKSQINRVDEMVSCKLLRLHEDPKKIRLIRVKTISIDDEDCVH